MYVVSMDLEKFFDTVSHSKLIEVLSRTIKDGRVVSLIHKYLNAGVIQNGFFEKTEEGVPQGGPLSPLCGNIMLNELDKELERRGHRFVRYADDALIFCKSRKSAERTLGNIIPYIEEELFLKVNRAKTTVWHVSKIKYLGYAFYRNKGKCRFRVHPKTVRKMKDRIREITRKSKGWGNEYRRQKLTEYVRGWIKYYKLADMKGLMAETDEWLRRRIRAIYWKQWKKVKTRYRNLRALKLEEWQVHQIANLSDRTRRTQLEKKARLAKKTGYSLIVRFSYGDRERETEEIHSLMSLHVDGMIIMPCHGKNYSPAILQLYLDDFPVVLIDKKMKGIPVPSVRTDNKAATGRTPVHNGHGSGKRA